MKITKKQLQKIIQEEIQSVLLESKSFWDEIDKLTAGGQFKVNKPDPEDSEFELYKGEDGEIPASAFASNLLSDPMSSGSEVVDSALDNSYFRKRMTIDELGHLIGHNALEKIIRASRRLKRGDDYFKIYAQGLAKAIYDKMRDPTSETIDRIADTAKSYFKRMDKHRRY